MSRRGTLSSPDGTTFAAGDDITAAIAGWPAGQGVTIRFDGKVRGTVAPDSSGAGTLRFTVPFTQPAGTYSLSAVSAVTGAKAAPVSITIAARPFQAGTMTVNKTFVPQGGAVTLTLARWTPGTTAAITLDDGTSLGSVTADGKGAASLVVRVPASTSTGTHRIVATAPDGSLVSVNISVTAAA